MAAKSLYETLHDFCQRQDKNQSYLIAYSGGLDSHVLLALCQQLRQTFPLKLRAIHVHHGLNAQADAWAAHCARVCQQYAIEFFTKRIHLNLAPSESMEALAREKRYLAFAELLHPDEILLTAHHQDDQAETLLLQLSRGAGIKGLAAMPPLKPFSCGWHARPLLTVSRLAIQQYAQAVPLQWIEDETNQALNITRNFFRHTILSPLKERWPTIAATISRTAMHCAEADSLLTEFANLLLEKVKGTYPHTLSVTKLLSFTSEQQRLMLRTWITNLGVPVLNTKKIAEVQQSMLRANRDRMPCIAWSKVELRRFKDDLHVVRPLPAKIVDRFPWDLTHSLALASLGHLHAKKTLGMGLSPSLTEVEVGFRQGGERAKHKSHGGRQSLKHLFQVWGVPTWERDYVPLIFKAEKLIAAVGYFIDPTFQAAANEWGLTLVWERNDLETGRG